MKLHLKVYIIILVIIFWIYLIYTLLNNNEEKIIKCNQKYALCPAAKCVPNPFDSNQAYCDCFVKTGVNYSVRNESCNNLQPFKESSNEYIYSTFSPIITPFLI